MRGSFASHMRLGPLVLALLVPGVACTATVDGSSGAAGASGSGARTGASGSGGGRATRLPFRAQVVPGLLSPMRAR